MRFYVANRFMLWPRGIVGNIVGYVIGDRGRSCINLFATVPAIPAM